MPSMLKKFLPDKSTAGDFRYEIKYICHETELYRINTWIRCHPLAFREAYPPRQVNNIYFDTHHLSNIDENLAGISERGKLRLRWYGNIFVFSSSVLEYKQKRASLGRKLSTSLNRVIDLNTMDWKTVGIELQKSELGRLAPLLAVYDNPSLINHYQREYFISADEKIRLTIDKDLFFFRQGLTAVPNIRYPAPYNEVLVVEIKSDASAHARIAEVSHHFPLRASAFSKYTTGILGMNK